MEETEEIIIDQKVVVWNRFRIQVPTGMTKEEFIDKLYEEDPRCNNQENSEFETLYDTEEVLQTEFFKSDSDLGSEPTKVWQ